MVAGRFGKSGGSAIQIVFLAMFGSIGVIAPYLTVIFAIMIVAWLYAVGALSKEFNKACKAQDEQA